MEYKVWMQDGRKLEIFRGGPFGITQEGVLYISWPNNKSPRFIFAKGAWTRIEVMEEPIVQNPVVDEPIVSE